MDLFVIEALQLFKLVIKTTLSPVYRQDFFWGEGCDQLSSRLLTKIWKELQKL